MLSAGSGSSDCSTRPRVIPADKRESVPSDSCRDDSALGREVLALLRSQRKSAGFMEEPAIAVAARMLNEHGIRLRRLRFALSNPGQDRQRRDGGSLSRPRIPGCIGWWL